MCRWTVLVCLLLLIIASAFFLFPSRPVRAASLCVNPGGTGGCYSTIQAAVDAALPGDTINIAAGTYHSVGTLKDITLQGSGNTVIVTQFGTADGIGVDTRGNISVTLKNLIITGNGWGIYAYGSTLQASNISVYSSEGLVCNYNATVVITDSVLSTLTRYLPLGCASITLVNDTFKGTVYPGSANSGVTATNTIFAGGCAQNPYDNFPIASLGHNIDIANNCILSATGDMTNTNPLLTPPVTVNGMLVNALMPGSPAIDTGDDSKCPPADITGFLRSYGTHCDMGAYEWRPMNFAFFYFPLTFK